MLLLAHGSPDRVEEIPEFLRYVTGGRGVPEAVVKEVQHRYSLIGRSPLTDITLKQAAGVERELGVRTYVGMRNWKPFVSDALERMKDDGVERAVTAVIQQARRSPWLFAALGREMLAAAGAPYP